MLRSRERCTFGRESCRLAEIGTANIVDCPRQKLFDSVKKSSSFATAVSTSVAPATTERAALFFFATRLLLPERREDRDCCCGLTHREDTEGFGNLVGTATEFV